MSTDLSAGWATPSASRFVRLLRPENLPDGDYPPVVIAPMVNQSELAFRLQCRRRSKVRLCFTPMINARQFVESIKYRNDVFTTCDEDRPLITQFCGNDPKMLLTAARLVEGHCDGIDINLGCPQHIAKRGRYGSFLLEHTELLESIVSTLSSNLSIPVSCKIRLVPGGLERTIELCTRLEKAGCEMITVHGRYREQNKHLIGNCDWDAIKSVKQAVKIPIVANGGIANADDVLRCYKTTGVDGVMTCEAVLENPALFNPDELQRYPDPFEVAYDYIELAKSNAVGQPKPARGHLFKFFATALARHPEFYMKFGKARTLDIMKDVCKELQDMHTSGACTIENCATLAGGPWYARYRGVHSLVIRGGGENDDDDGGGGGKTGHQGQDGEAQGSERPEKVAKLCGGDCS
jgi:tRNA-dihydrouridine synthase 1